ncbi:MAG: SUMF1/EgtB/PvdO family nonheme iron enzyme [Blastocatellales bacterium]
MGFAATHLRGGSWINNQDNARAVYRNNNHPANRNNNIGFRLVSCRPTPLIPLQWKIAQAKFGSFPFYQGAAASGIAGRVRFASRGEEIKKAQMNPVRTGEKHRRAHTFRVCRFPACTPGIIPLSSNRPASDRFPQPFR